MCVDFGTAFSKSFATIEEESGALSFWALPIGGVDSELPLLLPSEMVIEKDNIYLGARARKYLDDTQGSLDRLIDSIKQFVTLTKDVSTLNMARLDKVKDPTQAFSQREVLVLYLAYLMQKTEKALTEKGIPANVRRRFTHPAWKVSLKQKNENEMRVLMAQAIVLARSLSMQFGYVSTSQARSMLDQLEDVKSSELPLVLISEPVREATAAGAGAISGTQEHRRDTYLVIDVGAGTTDIAGFICVNNPSWERSRLFEITGAEDAKNMAGNVLDNALQKFILQKSALSDHSEEFRVATFSVRRNLRLFKERLFTEGRVVINLPTDETINVELADFRKYPPVIDFARALASMVAKAASVVVGDGQKVYLVATGGGSSLPFVRELAERGVVYEGRTIMFATRDPVLPEVRQRNPELISIYPQIAVALGGSLPNLPEQRANVAAGLKDAPVYVMAPSYKS